MDSFLLRSFLLYLVLLCSACTKTNSNSDPVVQKGKALYQANCTACHAPDPRVAGALGPDIAGSSLELIKARVMLGGYPEKYQPKRSSHIMQALPQLKDDIPALHAYLNSLK